MDKSTLSDIVGADDRTMRIRIAMLSSRVSQIEIARKLQVTKQAVNNVVCFRRYSERVREAICAATGMAYEKLWGEKERKDYNERWGEAITNDGRA